ncbi:MAG: fibronectin type III domain-containing protein [Dehalococcoidia bacterium]
MIISRRFLLAFICWLAVVSTFVLPGGSFLSLPAEANPGIMRWETVSTPYSYPGRNDILNPLIGGAFTGSEIRDLSVGNDSTTLLTAVTVDARYINSAAASGPKGILLASADRGLSWTTAPYLHLINSAGWPAGNHIYNVLIASDDPKLWAATTGTTSTGPVELWISSDAGASWSNGLVPGLAAGEAISAIDISVDYTSGRDFLVATRTSTGGGRIFITKGTGFGVWSQQANPTTDPVDYFSVKFSPGYAGDQSIVAVLANSTSTFYNIAVRDINNNQITSWVYTANGIEIVSSTSPAGASPSFATLATADISLPADFSGQTSSLRRAFISLNVPSPVLGTDESGIFRMDDSVPATLLSTTSSSSLQVYSIAFSGTYQTGKLLAGFVWGSPCNAAVPTLFADTPCICAGSCVYKSLKPPTGAANQGLCGSAGILTCSDNLTGIGSALVAWDHDGSLAYAATGSGTIADNITWWNSPSRPGPWISTLIPDDESALSISRNNGDTWNQLALIDTTIDWFNDVAVSSDCSTVYLASVNRNTGIGCGEFDSIWRSTVSPAATAPLPAPGDVGYYWERVFTHTTSICCRFPQTDLPILRTVPSCADPSDGGIVAWAAQYEPLTPSGIGGVLAWSSDYGDYWSAIAPSDIVQDFTFDTGSIIYSLSPLGIVQKLVYSGTGWSNTIPVANCGLYGHTIAARNGEVLVGAALANLQRGAIAYSADSGQNWYIYKDRMSPGGNVHVIFDVDYANNSFIYAATDDNLTGSVYRNTVPNFTRWHDGDLMDVSNGATGPDWWNDGYSQAAGDPPQRRSFFGIVMANTGDPQPALYAAQDNITVSSAPGPGELPSDSAVCRTLECRNGVPKPGVYWDCLDIFAPPSQNDVHFTLEPTSLKACGCCSVNTNTTLFAIDNQSGLTLSLNAILQTDNITGLLTALSLSGRYKQTPGYDPDNNRGMLWAYTDCLAKKGPVLRTPPNLALAGADPVSGRNQQIDLSWEQLCLSNTYEMQIAKDRDFILRVNPEISNVNHIMSVTGSILIETDPVNVTNPAAWLPPGSLPEAGAFYYWRIRTYRSATGQIAVSPWSEARSFKVAPGFVVKTPYLGVQLLTPANGSAAGQVSPASFSWSPWKDATGYEFELARDADFKQVVSDAHTHTTAYQVNSALDYNTGYFWRVRAVEVNGQQVAGDWSATFSFKTGPAPAPAKAAPAEPPTPLWVWAVLAAGAILIIITLVMIIRLRSQL